MIKNIVLVHGGFVDGSGWQPLYKILTGEGFNVRIVQNPTVTLADDVAVTKRAIAAADGPLILVGHSYGGVVISEAGTDPKVKGLVYVAAFAPDQGESVSSLIAILRRENWGYRSARGRMAFCSSIARNLRLRSPRMLNLNSQHSWRIRRCRGGSRHWQVRSVSRLGASSRVGTLSLPTTR